MLLQCGGYELIPNALLSSSRYVVVSIFSRNKFIMAEYSGYHSNQAQSLARNSHYSHHSVAPSTRSWVYPYQQNRPGPPPPQPLDLPTPVQPLRPLPNPHASSLSHSHGPHGPLRVVNNPDPLNFDGGEEIMNVDVSGPLVNLEFQPSGSGKGVKAGSWSNPSTGKSFVGGFVKGIRKLPRVMFGYGAGIGGGTLVTEGNTLPVYTSNPPTPVVGPGRSPLNFHHGPAIAMPQPTIPESPPPDVVRLDEQGRSNHNFRVNPHSESFANDDNGNFYDYNGLTDESSTTVMLYGDRPSHYYDRNQDTPAPTPPVVSRQLSTSPGLSYLSAEPLAPVRSASFHSSQGTAHVPPSIDVSQRIQTQEPGLRVSYASQTPPRRATPQSLIAGTFPSSSTPPQRQSQSQSHAATQVTDTNAVPADEQIQSPVSVHPEPANDYLKMTSSPPPTSHHTSTITTSFSDPSFFKTLYHMPWISHERVTVDYLPGEGLAKPLSSWRSSATLDLLSNGTRTSASPGTSLRASIALALGSPLAAQRNGHHRSHHHRSSSRHHRSHHSSTSHKKQRRKATWMDSTNTNTHADRQQAKLASSPFIPPVYPFQYPPYPYPPFSAFPVPAPAVVAEQPPQTQAGERPASPRGPRGESQQQQPMLYAPPAGYASYQPMISPQQVYLLQSASTQANNSVPPALVPGAGGPHVHAHTVQGGGQGQQQATSSGSGAGYNQNIPGAF
ncbi:hypothetical protein BDZ97DRAFT_1815464 [Flammula alnicola]|nr:hypothetical protein BDZ97DRAFT_1815464 [Flammula alnicola]